MTNQYHLIIGNKNYSSWSMRGWLTMDMVGAKFTETVVPLFRDDTASILKSLSTAPARVPVLKHGDRLIWDSLAIVEYMYEQYPRSGLWPMDQDKRATARCLCAEMHSSFAAIRSVVPMNIRGRRTITPSSYLMSDINRIKEIWSECLEKHEGPFLFGEYCAVDIFFAPVVTRLRTIEFDCGELQSYCDAVLSHPSVKKWCDDGEGESWIIESSE
jgi:glutathione S-transferase